MLRKIYDERPIFTYFSLVIIYTLFFPRRLDYLFQIGNYTPNLYFLIIILSTLITLLAKKNIKVKKVVGKEFLLIYFLFVLSITGIWINSITESYVYNDIIKSIEALLFIFFPMLIPILLQNYTFSKKEIKNFFYIFVFFGLVYSVISIWTVLFPHFLIEIFYQNPSLKGTRVLGDRGLIGTVKLGSFLPMVFPFYLELLYSNKKLKAFLSFIVLAILALGILFTGRRSSVIVIVILSILFMLKTANEGRKATFKILLGLVVLALLFLFLYVQFGIDMRVFKFFSISHISDDARFPRWWNSIKVFRENPILGTGLSSLETRDPHNAYLKILAEVGFLGLLGFLILLTFYLRKFFIALIKQYKDNFLFSILLGILAYLMVAFFDRRLWSGVLRTDTMFWMYLGLGLSYINKLSKEIA